MSMLEVAAAGDAALFVLTARAGREHGVPGATASVSPRSMSALPLLGGYASDIQARAEALLKSGDLGALVLGRYPDRHRVRTNKELNAYVQQLKARFMRTAPPLIGVRYDDRLHLAHNALGLHTTTTRVQGAALRKRREMRVASLFKDAPADFLRMIVVHELAHMKHAEHDRDFYKLCTYMEPDYHQLELDLRLYLTAQEHEK